MIGLGTWISLETDKDQFTKWEFLLPSAVALATISLLFYNAYKICELPVRLNLLFGLMAFSYWIMLVGSLATAKSKPTKNEWIIAMSIGSYCVLLALIFFYNVYHQKQCHRRLTV